jgi:hypothetical protein
MIDSVENTIVKWGKQAAKYPLALQAVFAGEQGFGFKKA